MKSWFCIRRGNILLVLLMVGMALAVCASAAASRLHLLPWPASVEMTEGSFQVEDRVRFTVSPQASSVAGITVESAIIEDVKRKIVLRTGQGEGWWLVTGKAELPDAPDGEEAYKLRVTPGGIALAASREAGFRHGIRTLLQLLAHGDRIPACEIDDKPAMPLRAFMVVIDMFRGMSEEDSLSILEDMAMFKMNVLRLGHVGRIMQDTDFREVVMKMIARSEELGVTVIPEMDMRPNPPRMRLSDDELHAEQDRQIREFVEIFPGPYIHIGCDEVRFEALDSVASRIQTLGAERFFANYLNRVNRIARKYDKTCIMWGDNIVRHHLNDTLKLLDPDIIVEDWNYNARPPVRGVRLMRDAGISGLLAPAVAYSGASVICPGKYNMDNIRYFAAYAKEFEMLGLNATVWGAQRCLPGSLERAYGWAADQAWNPGGNDERGAMAAYLVHRFGLEPTRARVERIWRLREVGQPQGRLNRYLWDSASALARHGDPGQQSENAEYAKAVEGIADGFRRDLRHVKANRKEYESLITVAAVGEHNALRRLTAQEVVTRVRDAVEALEAGDRSDAASELRFAAEAVKRMNAEHKKLHPQLEKIWRPYYGDLEIWWFTTPEAEAYVEKLAAQLDELAKNPDIESVKGLL